MTFNFLLAEMALVPKLIQIRVSLCKMASKIALYPSEICPLKRSMVIMPIITRTHC